MFSRQNPYIRMTEQDIVFRLIPDGENADPNSFCHFGWEGIGAFALWRYATAYFESANYLFEKFVASAGDNGILDGTGITMCFLYRHFVELSIKHLYVKFASPNATEYKKFLENGHHLMSLWNETKPILSKLRRRVGSSVSLGVLEHYVEEVDKFDPDEMAMRYPVKNDLSPMHQSSRLDILNLHERMTELFWALYGIANDLDGQLEETVEKDKVEAFLSSYEELRPRMKEILASLESFVKTGHKEKKWLSMVDIKPEMSNGCKQMELLTTCTDDEIIMLDTLYYTGRNIAGGQLNLPKNPYEAKIDTVKMCVLNMERDHLEFGKPKSGGEINVDSKSESSIIHYVNEAMSVIDWVNNRTYVNYRD